MKRFHFKLETVKKLRELHLDQAMQAYSQAMEMRKQAESFILQLQEHLHRHEQELVSVRSGQAFGAAVQDVWQSGHFHILHEIEKLGERLQELRKAENEARERFFQARMQVKSIEQLEEKDRKEHLREGERAEELELEDMINARRNL